MNDHRRHTPGRVSEPARAVDEQPAERSGVHSSPRQPGRITADAHPIADTLAENPPASPRQRWYQRPWRSSFYLLIMIILFSGLWQWVSILQQRWQDGAILIATLLSLFSLLLAGLVIIAIIRERRACARITRLATRRHQAQKALQADDLSALKAALQPTLETLAQKDPGLIKDFQAATQSETRAAGYARCFENLVLNTLDEQANAKINQATLTIGTLVAAVPHPALDALVVIWRALILIRDLGRIYGLAPTGLSALRLFRYALGSAVLAAGTHAAGEVVLDEFGRGVLNSAGKKVSESAVSAARMRRLGKMTQNLIRPLEKTPEHQAH